MVSSPVKLNNDALTSLYAYEQVIPNGLACQSGLRVGDRILEVNTIDLRHATHQEAVKALLSNKQEIRLLVRRDPSPPGMQVHTHTIHVANVHIQTSHAPLYTQTQYIELHN